MKLWRSATGRRWLAAGTLAAGVVLVPGVAGATQIPVTTTTDELNADGDCSLREAVEAANTDLAVDACPAGAGADVIELTGGSTYALALAGADEDANATGDLDLTSELTLQSTGTDKAIIDAAGVDRALHVGVAATVTLEGIEVTGGMVFPGNGGGILNNGVLTLTNSTVQGNTARGDDGQLRGGGFGGGIYNAGTVTMTGATFTENKAQGGKGVTGLGRSSGGGGGAGLGGAIFNAAGATVVAADTAFGANTANGGGGGKAGDCDDTVPRVSGNGGGAGGAGGTPGTPAGAGGFGGGGGAAYAYATGGAGGFGGGGGGAGPSTGGGQNNDYGAAGFGAGRGGTATFSCGAGGGGGAGLGGAIFDNGGSVELTDVRLQTNTAARGSGGGGHFSGSSGVAGNGWGGALFTNGGAIDLLGTSQISDNNQTSSDTTQADCGVTAGGAITAASTVATVPGTGCPVTATPFEMPYISTVTVLDVGDATCPNGGVTLHLGFDDGSGLGVRSDGTLTDAEVESSFDVCNGEDGQVGQPGQNGADGATALIGVSNLPSGDANCAHGGQQLDVGIDNGDGGETAGDGVLGAGEIDSTAYVCNGADASVPLVTVTEEPAGDNCASGGQRIDAGLDGDGNGVLDEDEVTTTTWVCDGADGATGANGADAVPLLTRTRDLLPGEDLCAPATGFLLEIGHDLNRDGELSNGEVETSSALCNGVPGAAGKQGPQGEPGPQGASGCSSTGGKVPGAFGALMLLGLWLVLRRGRADSAI